MPVAVHRCWFCRCKQQDYKKLCQATSPLGRLLRCNTTGGAESSWPPVHQWALRRRRHFQRLEHTTTIEFLQLHVAAGAPKQSLATCALALQPAGIMPSPFAWPALAGAAASSQPGAATASLAAAAAAMQQPAASQQSASSQQSAASLHRPPQSVDTLMPKWRLMGRVTLLTMIS
jgi:hypothetical protein